MTSLGSKDAQDFGRGLCREERSPKPVPPAASDSAEG